MVVPESLDHDALHVWPEERIHDVDNKRQCKRSLSLFFFCAQNDQVDTPKRSTCFHNHGLNAGFRIKEPTRTYKPQEALMMNGGSPV